MAINLTPAVNCKYGAPMGRGSWDDNRQVGVIYAGKMQLSRIRLNNGGYDSGGSYWGVGQRLYGYVAVDDSVNGFVRAYDRDDAKEQVRAKYPEVTFFGEKHTKARKGE